MVPAQGESGARVSTNPYLISAAELDTSLGRPGLSVIDASWYLPAQKRFARAEFETAHVPGAVFFDQDAIVDPRSALPHALPSAADFAAAVGRLGVADTDTIVVYDGVGLFTAPRVWWMFRTFGAKDVRVLDGGFPAWREGGYDVEAGEPSPEPKPFHAALNGLAVSGLNDMRGLLRTAGRQIIDARPGERFRGDVPEPREGVRAGHMPGAFSVPFTELAENGRLKSADDLRRVFASAGVDPDAPAVTSCGSGVTAAVVNLALATLGNRDATLYDGSWTEWGSAPDTPVETGPRA